MTLIVSSLYLAEQALISQLMRYVMLYLFSNNGYDYLFSPCKQRTEWIFNVSGIFLGLYATIRFFCLMEENGAIIASQPSLVYNCSQSEREFDCALL